MAVLTIDEEKEIPVVTRKETQTSVIFNSEEDIKSITQYIAGGKWSVTMFTQVGDINTEYVLPDTNIPRTEISYYKINDLIIYTETNIEMSNVEDITGNGTINAGYIPKYGDAFIAKVMGGRIGLFIITEVNKKIYNLHDIFDIEFKLHTFIDSDPTMYNDLVLKTVKEYTYDKDAITDYNAPIILNKDYIKKTEYKRYPREITRYYIDNFMDEESNTIILPTEASIFMDQYLLDFIFKVVSTDDDYRIIKLTRYQIDKIDDVTRTIFDILINKRVKLIKKLNRNLKFYLIPPASARPQVSMLYYSNISYIIRDVEYDLPKFNIIENDEYLDRDIETFEEPLGNTARRYVFTDAFYNYDLENMGYFEKLVYSYLEDSVINEELLSKALLEYETWSTLDQYYLLPILVLIVRSASQHIYMEL